MRPRAWWLVLLGVAGACADEEAPPEPLVTGVKG